MYFSCLYSNDNCIALRAFVQNQWLNIHRYLLNFFALLIQLDYVNFLLHFVYNNYRQGAEFHGIAK